MRQILRHQTNWGLEIFSGKASHGTHTIEHNLNLVAIYAKY